MPRNMSFAMTTEQFIARTKTVTRRFGWWFLREGDIVCGVEKAMGLKRGEQIKRLGLTGVSSAQFQDATTGESSEPNDASDAYGSCLTSESVKTYQFSGRHARVLGEEPIVIFPAVPYETDYTVVIIPAGTQAIIAFYFCNLITYCGPDEYALSLDGIPFVHITTDGLYLACSKLINPPTGELMFSWNLLANPEYAKTHIALVCLTDIDTSTDPILSSGWHGAEWYDGSTTGLSFEGEKDIVVGMICATDDDFYSGVQASFPLVPRGVQQKLAPTMGGATVIGGAWRTGQVAVNWGVSRFDTWNTGTSTKVSSIAVVIRGLDLGSIEQGGFDRGVLENSFLEVEEVSPNTIQGPYVEDIPLRIINGIYVDIPERLLFSEALPRPNHFANMRENPYGEFYMYPNADTSLIVVAYVTSMPEATWHYAGNYTLTLNGVAFTHLYNTVGQYRNMMVAYLKNPTPGMLVSNFPNPYLPRVEDDWSEPTDIWMMAQFIGVDVSGDPIRSFAFVADTDPTGENAVTGLTFEEGDLTMAIGAGGFAGYPPIGDRHIVSASAYHVSMGWYMGISAGGIPAGAASISGSTVTAEVPESRINLFGMVLKVDPTLYEVFAQEADLVDTLGTTESTAGNLYFEGVSDQSSTVSEEWTGTADGMILAEAGDTLTLEPTAYGSRTAAAFFGRMDVVDVSETISAWEVGFATADESVLLEEILDGMRLVYGVSTEDLFPGDLLSSERFVDVVTAELFTGSEEPVATMVCWDFTADTSMVLDIPTAVAEMYPSVMEISTIIDGYSAILIEYYFPAEVNATYDRVEYTAVLEVPAVTASYAREEIEATYSATAMTASFIREEIVAKYEPIIFTATKGV